MSLSQLLWLQVAITFMDTPVTVNAVQNIVEENILNLLSTVTGEIRASADTGCSINAVNTAGTDANEVFCDTAVSADDIVTEIDAVAEAGAHSSTRTHAPHQCLSLWQERWVVTKE